MDRKSLRLPPFSLLVIISLVLAGVIAYSCSSSCNSVPSEPKKILRLSANDDPTSLDPRMAGDGESQTILRMLFEGLTRIGEHGTPEPATASSIEISDDLKTYIFHLRESRWSDGSPVTASDFAYAWKQVLSPSFPSVYAYAFYVIKNARAVKEGRLDLDMVGISVKDNHTLVVELEHPAPYFLELTANPLYSPVPCHILENQTSLTLDNSKETLVSNGPFRLENRTFKRGLELRKNRLYWDKHSVSLDGISISIIPDPETTLMMFENNELDWVGEPISNIPLDAAPLLRKTNQLTVGPQSTLFWLVLNVNRPPLNSVKIRRALASAINRQKIVDYLLVSEESPAMSILPANLTLANEPYFKDNDIQIAKALFAEGLEDLGLDMSKMKPIKILAPSIRYRMAQVIQEQWTQALGIPVKLDTSEWGTCLSKLAKRDFDVATMGWVSWCHDPIYNLEIMRYRSTDKNYSGWESEKYIELLKASDETYNKEARDQYLREAEKLVITEMPIIPVFSRGPSHIKKENIDNVYLSPLGHPEFKYTTIH